MILNDNDRIAILNMVEEHASARVNQHLAAKDGDAKRCEASDKAALTKMREINYRLGGGKPE